MLWLFSGDEKNHLSPFAVEIFKMAAINLANFTVFCSYLHLMLYDLFAVNEFYYFAL